ncbi:MAG: IS1595 family transposase [Planctomycetes bacterium]|nr:IS1595 family transposase [Planctomycetota bacterium]
MSATVGTIMERSRVPLSTWFAAASAVATHPMGLSARRFAQQQGLRYETAFHLLQRLRAGLVDPDQSPLRGIVAVDVVLIGGHRDPRRDVPVAIAVEHTADADRQPGRGRTRFRVLDQIQDRTLQGFLGDHVAVGSVVASTHPLITASLRPLGYRTYASAGHAHAHAAVGQVFAQVSRWLGHTHGHAVSRQHLQAYLNEAAFRLQYGSGQQAFRAALGLSMHVEAPRQVDITRVRLRRRAGWQHTNPIHRHLLGRPAAASRPLTYPVGSPSDRRSPPTRYGDRRTRVRSVDRPSRRWPGPIRLAPATRHARIRVYEREPRRRRPAAAPWSPPG